MNKKIVVTSLLALGLVGAGSSIAHADHVGGGEWSFGVGSKYVWSYYDHDYRYHSSSVKGKYWADSGRTAPGYEAQASAQKAMWGNKSYYNYW